MCVVFQDPENAARWCMHVQAELLKADWPVEILTHPAASEEWADVDDRVIFRVSQWHLLNCVVDCLLFA